MLTVLLIRIVKAKHIDGFRRQALNEAMLIARQNGWSKTNTKSKSS